MHLRIAYTDVLYVEASSNYTKLHTAQKTYLTQVSISRWEKELPDHLFCKVHRSFIISVAHLQCFDKDSIYLGEVVIPFVNRYRLTLLEKIKVIHKPDMDCIIKKPNLRIASR